MGNGIKQLDLTDFCLVYLAKQKYANTVKFCCSGERGRPNKKMKYGGKVRLDSSPDQFFILSIRALQMVVSECNCTVKSQDDQKMKNIQNAEDYYDDADEDSRDGKIVAYLLLTNGYIWNKIELKSYNGF